MATESRPAPVRAGENGLLRDEVYRAVVDQIVAGRLVPGMRISERSLAAEFGVSRMPVKEAVRRLENEGFVRALPRHGIVVATSAQDSLREAIAVRAVLEGLAAGLLADRFRDGGTDVSDLRLMLRRSVADMRLASSKGDAESLRGVNSRFHEFIRTACGNRYLPGLTSAVLAVDAAVRRNALADVREMRRGIAEHARIVRRVLDGDARSAEQVMRSHIERSGHFVLSRMSATETEGHRP